MNFKKTVRVLLMLVSGIGLVINLFLVRSVWLAYSSWTEQIYNAHNWLLPINKHVELVVRSHTFEGEVVDFSLDSDTWTITLIDPYTNTEQTVTLPNQVHLPTHFTKRTISRQEDHDEPYIEQDIELNQFFEELQDQHSIIITVNQLKDETHSFNYLSGITLVDHE